MGYNPPSQKQYGPALSLGLAWPLSSLLLFLSSPVPLAPVVSLCLPFCFWTSGLCVCLFPSVTCLSVPFLPLTVCIFLSLSLPPSSSGTTALTKTHQHNNKEGQQDVDHWRTTLSPLDTSKFKYQAHSPREPEPAPQGRTARRASRLPLRHCQLGFSGNGTT